MYQTRFKALLALLILGASIPALSQVVPEVNGRQNLPFRVGAGYSNYATNANGGGRLGGPTVWIDYDVPKMPPDLTGLQFEVEGRDLNYTRDNVTDPNLRQYSFAGGLNLAWRYDPAFHPYAKFLVGIGNENFTSSLPNYRKDSRAFYAPAVGIDVRAYKRLWIRANYEYQFWPDFFHPQNTQHPNGFTIGAFFDFSKFALIPYR